MKKFITAICLFAAFQMQAQKVEFKNGIIKVDDADYLKMEVKKTNFGLTKTFEVFSLAGEKLIIAVPATEFESDKTDNTYLFYRLTFLTSNQIGIFKISSLGQEKSFVKLIGNSGIIANDKTVDEKVKQFIATSGASPRIAVNYTLVNRSKNWPISLKKGGEIEQESAIIGNFKPSGSSNSVDFYEFSLPSGVIIAKLSFTGGNNAQNFELFTAKNNLKRMVPLPTSDKILAADFSIDKNQFMLKRVTKWLVDNNYL